MRDKTIEVPAPKVLLLASKAVTAGWATKLLPVVVVADGCVVNARELIAPGLIFRLLKQVEERVPSVALRATTLVFNAVTPVNDTTPEELDGVPELKAEVTCVMHEESE